MNAKSSNARERWMFVRAYQLPMTASFPRRDDAWEVLAEHPAVADIAGGVAVAEQLGKPLLSSLSGLKLS